MADLVLEISETLYVKLAQISDAKGISIRDEVLLCLNHACNSPYDDEDLLGSTAEVEVTIENPL